jgi:uncharacterized phage protein gp47/JayE
MLNRVVSRTTLNDSRTASGIRNLLAAAAAGDEQNSFKIISLLDLYSIDRARRADLDERAADFGAVTGGNMPPRESGRRSAGKLECIRAGTSGTITIPKGTRVQRVGGGQKVTAVTTADGAITVGLRSSGLISAVTEQTGSYTASAPGTFKKLLSRIPGVISVTNPVSFQGGLDEEKDEEFRQRIKDYVRSLPLCTPRAMEALALQVELESGERVLAAKAIERADEPGRGTLYIDDGTGTVAVGQIQGITGETVLASATGGELLLQLERFPVVDTETITVYRNDVALTEGTDYSLMIGPGVLRLDDTAFPAGLTAEDIITADYSYYTGLIAETQWRVDGRADNPTDYPGWRAFGAHIVVKPPTALFMTVDAVLTLKSGYVRSTAVARANAAVSRYINQLNIGADPIRNEIIERIMGVPGMLDLVMTEPPSNTPVGDTAVARIKDTGLLIR